MKRNFLIILIIILSNIFGFNIINAQKVIIPEDIQLLPKLSTADSIGLMNLPKLTLPEWLKGANAPLLPVGVDNSENMFWRPVYAQVDLECGQASGIGLGYTYEINRLRNLPSNVADNQYPTHYCWNWANGGNGWYGVSYFHSFEILKAGGTPDVNTYGGMYVGNSDERVKFWMSGYDKYYEAMHNRINELYQIDVSTPEGILTLKNWIHNHLEGSDVGGVANFYANAPYGMSTLPNGTPEAGKYVVLSWGGANHGLTICAYHDSIRWDYNSDGQYTNDIDINNDGVVNVRDWEIGGFKFANTYSGGPSFGNNGFSYMTYKSCADPSENGGIWNNAVHVQFAKEQCDPLLTARITLKHVCREKIKVRMGYSTDVNATSPEFILEFPIFNYQGSCKYLQGGTTEEDKTLEFGLDLTPFLNMIGSGTPARYFLLVNEDDPSNQYEGEIVQYSIIDYSNGMNEIDCGQSNITLVNGVNKLWVDHTVAFDGVDIADNELPEATVYEPYQFLLSPEGGSSPYYFDFDMNFAETSLTETFPAVNAEQLNPSNNNDGFAYKTLDFDFPFYDEVFSQVKVNVDGFIALGDYSSWPYQVYDFLLFAKNKFITPFNADLRIYPSSGDGMWYDGEDGYATFRWKVSVNGQQNTSELNFAVRLFENGDIKYYYGENDFSNVEWISAVSAGNNIYYQFTDVSNNNIIPPNYVCNLSASHKPDGFTLSPDGFFSGLPEYVYDNFEIRFRVSDSRNITATKPLYFSTDGTNFLVIDDYSVNSGGNDIIEFGESPDLSVIVRSLGEQVISDVNMSILIDDEYVNLTDSTEFLGNFDPSEVKSFTDAFSFDISNLVPNNYQIDFTTVTTDDTGSEWESHIYLTAWAPVIVSAGLTVDDGGNGGLDPGETTDLILSLHNSGGAQANNLDVEFSSNDPYVVINSNLASIASIAPNSNEDAVFNVTVSNEVPIGYIIAFDVFVNADNEYSNATQVFAVVGLLNESFETGDFSAMPWQFAGNAEWVIDNDEVYMGNFSARSGSIEDEETSSLEMEVCFLVSGEVSFAHKISSEATYDYLKFYIDGSEMESWEGEEPWSESSYNITSGVHTLRWTYEKDYSVSNGSDCGWIDYISLPPFGDSDPQVVYSPEVINDSLVSGEIVQDTITISNIGSGSVIYSIEVTDTLGNPVEWITLDQTAGGLNANSSDDIIATINSNGLEEGDYVAKVTITDHMNNEYEVQVFLNVDILSGIDENSNFYSGCYPNPFAGTTTIIFTLDESASTTLGIFDNRGSLVKLLINGEKLNNGNHTTLWDATDNTNHKVQPGLYFYRLISGNNIHVGKVIVY